MSHTATIDGKMDADEVRRRFPEVSCINDDEVREQTIDAIARGVPEYFWHVPATGSGKYHNPFSRHKHGLWIHVKMVFSAYERFVNSFEQMDLITAYEADCGRAAVLLHDMLKYGHEYSSGDSSVSNHDKLGAHWLTHNTPLDPAVIACVDSHNGKWYDGMTPRYQEEPLEILVHMADMAASTKNGTWGVYEPASEIHQKYPNIPRADL